MLRWYAIRVSYGRVLKVSAKLQESGFECFVPMSRKTVEKKGVKTVVVVPAVSNLCFVRSDREFLDAFLYSQGDERIAGYLWDKSTHQPIVVPDKPMQDFMQVCRVMSDDILYLKEVSEKFREGYKVRVKEGPFEGIEGTVIRVKRSRRVMVELPGMLAVATAYIEPRCLELL